MKLFMQANMHKISEEFDIEANLIVNNSYGPLPFYDC